MASMPVLVDDSNGTTVQQSTSIIEYLDALGPRPLLVPADAGEALQARLWDCISDAYVMTPMQKIVAGRVWLAGATFGLADCAAAPALSYARVVHRFDEQRLRELTRYVDALTARPSVVRVIDGARPYRELFPLPWPDHAT